MSIEYTACQNVNVVFSMRNHQTGAKVQLPAGTVLACSNPQPSVEAAKAQLFAEVGEHGGPRFSHHRRLIPVGDVVVYQGISLWSRLFGV